MSEWWNVLASVVRVNAWAQYLTLIFLVLSAATTVLSLSTTRRIAVLKDEATKEVLEQKEAKSEAALINLKPLVAANPPEPKRVAEEAKPKADETDKSHDRHLTADQKQKLTSLLASRPKGAVNVAHMANDPESEAFAKEILGALVASGWKAASVGATGEFPGSKGLHFQIKSIQEEPENAKYIIHTFIELGMKPNTELNKSLPDFTLRLVVGHR